MDWVIIVTVLALLQCTWFGAEVGFMRGKHGVKAPAMSGPPEFERAYRIHYNTLEQLVIFIPALYATAYFVSDLYAVAAGVVFLVGRAIYFRAYCVEAGKRSTGMIITALANLSLILGALVGALLDII